MKLIILLLLFLSAINLFSQDLIPYRNQKLWGYANQNGKIIIEPQYEKALPFWKNGLAKVKKDGFYILINSKNEIKTHELYTEIFEFKNGLAAVCKGGEFEVMQGEIVGGNWGYISETNFNEVIPLTYSRVESFNGNYAIVQKDGNWGNWGVIDKTGKIILPFKYTTYSFDMRPFQGIIWHGETNKLEVDISGNGDLWNLIDIKGLKISGPVSNLHGMNIPSPKDVEYEALKKAEINKETKIREANYIIKTPQGDLTCSGDVTAIAKGIYIADRFDENKINKFGVIDENNKILIPFEYDYISTEISEGLIVVAKDKKYGYCDLNNNEVIICKYASADKFNNGIAKVYVSRNDYSINSTGYINKMGIEFFKSDPIYQVTKKGEKYTVTDQYFNPVKLDADLYDYIEIINKNYFLTFTPALQNSHKLFNASGSLMAKGIDIERATDNCVLVTDNTPDNSKTIKLFNFATGKIIIDSIDHVASKISDPTTYKIFGYTYITKKGLFGLYTFTDKALIPAKYTFIQFTGAYFILKDVNNKFAICDTNYHFIRDFSTDNISYLTKDLFSIQNKNLNEIYDARTNKLSNYKIKISKINNALLTGVFENSKKQLGYINPVTQEILDPSYIKATTIRMFNQYFNPVDLILFAKSNGKYDIYNTQTAKIIIVDCDGVENIQGRWLPVKKDNKYNLYDNNGTKAFDTNYEAIRTVKSDGYTAAKLNGKWGVIDRANKPVASFIYDDISNMVDYLVFFANENKYGVLDINDTVLISPQYQSIDFISVKSNDSLPPTYFFLAQKNDKKGIIDQKNEIIAPFDLKGESEFSFNEDVFVIYKNNKPVLFNNEGKIILTGDYDRIEPFDTYDSSGHEYVKVTKGKKYGLFTITGKMILNCVYDKLEMNNDYYDSRERSYFTIEKDGKYGLVCNTGEIILQAVCDNPIQVFYSDDKSYQLIKSNGKYGLYTNFRKKLSDCIYKNIEFEEESVTRNTFILNLNGKYGILDSTGKLIVPIMYDKISIYPYDSDILMYEIIQAGKKGLVNNDGKIIVPPQFDKIEPIYDIDNLGFYVYKGKLFGIIGPDGKEISETKFINKEYSDYDQYMLIFMTKDKEQYGLTPNFVIEKINK